MDFVKKVLEQDRVRMIGVCFGHQVIGRALGVKVGRSDEGWEIAVLPVQLTVKGKELFKQDTLVRSSPLMVALLLTSDRAFTKCTETLFSNTQKA